MPKFLSRHLTLIRIYIRKVIQSWLRPDLGLKVFSSNILGFFDTHDSSDVKDQTKFGAKRRKFWLHKKFSLLGDHMKINFITIGWLKVIATIKSEKNLVSQAIEMSSSCNQNHHFPLQLTIMSKPDFKVSVVCCLWHCLIALMSGIDAPPAYQLSELTEFRLKNVKVNILFDHECIKSFVIFINSF